MSKRTSLQILRQSVHAKPFRRFLGDALKLGVLERAWTDLHQLWPEYSHTIDTHRVQRWSINQSIILL